MSAIPTNGAVRIFFAAWCAACGAAASDGGAIAAIPVELEVAAMPDAPLGAIQEWAPVLGQLGLAHLRLRGFQNGDKPAIEAAAVGDAKLYRVVGVLNRQDQLVLPGARFGQQDQAALKRFFEELPIREEEKHLERGLFGLTRPQFQKVFNDLSPVVDRSTKGAAPGELATLLAAEFKTPLAMDADAAATLNSAAKLNVELRGLSTGTVLAAALRAAGLGMTPELGEGGALLLRVAPSNASHKAWPVGWKPERLASQEAPAMYKSTVIEIEGYTLSKALEALAPHMGVPLVFDQRILRERRIDPSAVTVKFKRGKSYIRRAVDMLLSQGRLAGELRVDEAGKPFYWITQWGPESQRAR